jgi:hypothetical protein
MNTDSTNDEMYQLALRQFTEDTTKAFETAFAGKWSMVEWYSQETRRIKLQMARDAIMEELEYVETQDALIAVLRDSKCPLVAALKKSIVDGYINRHGPDVAEIRSQP